MAAVAAGKQVTRATKKERRRVKHVPKMTPNWVNMAPTCVPKWINMAPGRLPDGLWRPWGPLGGPSQIFQRFWSSCGGRFGTRKSTKTMSNLKLDSSITLHRHFQPSEGLLGHCWHPFRDHFGVLGGPLEAILAPLGLPGGQTSRSARSYFLLASLDPPKTPRRSSWALVEPILDPT